MEISELMLPTLPGALIINTAYFLQASLYSLSCCKKDFSSNDFSSSIYFSKCLLTNDNYKSINHRVASNKGPRVSSTSAFRTHFQEGITPKPHRPIEEEESEKDSFQSYETSQIAGFDGIHLL
ncbi:hypothetical protein RJ639_044029 [Escallonia herrerae]|uniref:Uncharacterized protein n=1 Tax=Escallonia herrerae TaxID=1293975 RepID=A0AA88WD72_9ASTE|nr:hypothetical protein RJ639_044029 [Escallonia herrerae]